MTTIFSMISRVWDKAIEFLHYPLGWLAGFGLFVLDALTGGKTVIYVVVLVVLVDFICGIAVSLKQKSFAKSELMRLTVEKIAVYGAALVAFLCLDKAIESGFNFDLNITTAIVGAVIALSEIWSFTASLLILFPSNPFLRLFQKALTGEIAHKLGCDEKEVSKILNLKRNAKSQPRGKDGKFQAKK